MFLFVEFACDEIISTMRYDHAVFAIKLVDDFHVKIVVLPDTAELEVRWLNKEPFGTTMYRQASTHEA